MLLYESESSDGQPTVGRVVVDEERVYFTVWPEVECESDQTIVSIPKEGGELVTVVGKEHRMAADLWSPTAPSSIGPNTAEGVL